MCTEADLNVDWRTSLAALNREASEAWTEAEDVIPTEANDVTGTRNSEVLDTAPEAKDQDVTVAHTEKVGGGRTEQATGAGVEQVASVAVEQAAGVEQVGSIILEEVAIVGVEEAAGVGEEQVAGADATEAQAEGPPEAMPFCSHSAPAPAAIPTSVCSRPGTPASPGALENAPGCALPPSPSCTPMLFPSQTRSPGAARNPSESPTCAPCLLPEPSGWHSAHADVARTAGLPAGAAALSRRQTITVPLLDMQLIAAAGGAPRDPGDPASPTPASSRRRHTLVDALETAAQLAGTASPLARDVQRGVPKRRKRASTSLTPPHASAAAGRDPMVAKEAIGTQAGPFGSDLFTRRRLPVQTKSAGNSPAWGPASLRGLSRVHADAFQCATTAAQQLETDRLDLAGSNPDPAAAGSAPGPIPSQVSRCPPLATSSATSPLKPLGSASTGTVPESGAEVTADEVETRVEAVGEATAEEDTKSGAKKGDRHDDTTSLSPVDHAASPTLLAGGRGTRTRASSQDQPCSEALSDGGIRTCSTQTDTSSPKRRRKRRQTKTRAMTMVERWRAEIVTEIQEGDAADVRDKEVPWDGPEEVTGAGAVDEEVTGAGASGEGTGEATGVEAPTAPVSFASSAPVAFPASLPLPSVPVPTLTPTAGLAATGAGEEPAAVSLHDRRRCEGLSLSLEATDVAPTPSPVPLLLLTGLPASPHSPASLSSLPTTPSSLQDPPPLFRSGAAGSAAKRSKGLVRRDTDPGPLLVQKRRDPSDPANRPPSPAAVSQRQQVEPVLLTLEVEPMPSSPHRVYSSLMPCRMPRAQPAKSPGHLHRCESAPGRRPSLGPEAGRGDGPGTGAAQASARRRSTKGRPPLALPRRQSVHVHVPRPAPAQAGED